MSEVVSWVSDQLHSILGLSDRFLAEYLVGLAKKSSTPEVFESKIRETNTITVNHAVRTFLDELWGKVPHKQLAEKPARIYEREILLQQQQNKSYRLLSDSDEEIPNASNKASNIGKKSTERARKHKNIRKAKISAWDSESDEDNLSSSIKVSKEDSDDEWDRQVDSAWCICMRGSLCVCY